MTGRQLASLWFAGFVRAILAIPLVVIPAVVIWLIPSPSDPVLNFSFIVMLIIVLFGGVYLSFTAFGFIGDAITRNVSYVTGQMERSIGSGYRGRRSYFMVVGPVRTAVRKQTFDALPVGVFCYAYYASGSMYLLSLEPTTAEVPHPTRRFGDDPTHAWNRMRSSWLVPLVAAFALAAGVHEVIAAHAVHTLTVSGTIGDYYETSGRTSGHHLRLAGSTREYDLKEIRPLYGYIGDKVDLYINADQQSDVLALRVRGMVFAGDLYLHPEHQYSGMIAVGASIAVVSGGVLAWLWLRKRRAANQPSDSWSNWS